MALKSFTSL